MKFKQVKSLKQWFKSLIKLGIKPPDVLFYDIETSLLMFLGFSCGEQVVRHTQLVPPFDRHKIICLSYCINDGPIKTLKYDYDTQDDSNVIEEFDAIVRKHVANGGIMIGKNSDRFDVKMINASRFLNGQEPFPDWAMVSDDLEKQMRKYFRFPSQSLDYISNQLGLGGKMKMEFDDWKHIALKTIRKGKAAFNKMCKYCPKDVHDTRTIFIRMLPYIEWKMNMSAFAKASGLCDGIHCKACGSTKIAPNGTRQSGKTVYQQYQCKSHHGYAGRRPINGNGVLG